MSEDVYSFEINSSGFCYLTEGGKKIASMFGKGTLKKARAEHLVKLLNANPGPKECEIEGAE